MVYMIIISYITYIGMISNQKGMVKEDPTSLAPLIFENDICTLKS